MAVKCLVELFLASPVAAGPRGWLTLDALIGGIAYERWKCPDRALAEVAACFSTMDEQLPVPLASAAVFAHASGKPMRAQIVTDTMGTSLIQHSPRILGRVTNTRAPKITAMTMRDRTYSAISSDMEVVEADSLCWAFTGDADRVRDMLDGPCARFIGSWRRRGFGQVREVVVREVESEETWFGAVAGGRAIRPIPSRAAATLGGTVVGAAGAATWCSRYSDTSRQEPCLLPPVTQPRVTVALDPSSHDWRERLRPAMEWFGAT